MSRTLRVLHLENSASDSELVRAELERGGLKVVLERLETQDGLYAAVQTFAPDVILSDHAHDRFDARAALQDLRRYYPAAPLILVLETIDDQVAVTSLREGAENIVLKRNLGRLAEAIDTGLAVRRRLRKLTPRQMEVLRLVTAGHTTREIARRLKLSAKTVESHRGEVMKRLGMHEVVGLVRYAVRVGLVTSDY
jgi:DNA-binding NarL/FixJ family response regulator